MAAVNGVEVRIGQRWLTRGGHVARITGLGRPSDLRPVQGLLGDFGRSWTSTGTFRARGESGDDLTQLIVEAPEATQAQPFHVESTVASGGGKLARATNYYQVEVETPIDLASTPYVAECADIIEALNMTFNEGEAFKAIWRLAAARQGRGKPGNKPEYDADKAAHYGARIAAQTRKGGA